MSSGVAHGTEVRVESQCVHAPGGTLGSDCFVHGLAGQLRRSKVDRSQTKRPLRPRSHGSRSQKQTDCPANPMI